MTMDVNNSGRKLEMKSDQISPNCEEQTITPVKVAKRPFDVAFLMLPDEKFKQKKVIKSYDKLETTYNNNEADEDEEIEVGNSQDFIKGHKYFTQKQQIFDDPNLIKAKNLEELRQKPEIPTSSEQKSAFTKVNLRLSPNLSISPDLSYQNSLSPSPPILNRNYPSLPPNMLSPTQLFKSQQINAYQNSFLPESFAPSSNLENPFPNFPKMRPMYRPDLPYNYQQFHNQDMLKMASPEIRNPAAAILTSLLPPSLAALSLPAQNVCAKCNISFRMTSDLVYHMRSHHKNDSVDVNRRRREEKLKCPVCSESFRERHHLTRHMTAHQDKEEEGEGGVKKKCVPNVH